MALGRTYWDLNEIWVADLDPNVSTTEALGAGRTIEQHYHEMVRHYTRRIDTEPEDAINYVARARFYISLEDKEKAAADLEQCAKLLRSREHPAVTLVTRLAVLCREQERYDEIEPVFDRVLAFSFHMVGGWFPPSRQNRLALFQAAFPSAEFRDGAKAVENATKACERTKWKNREYIGTLAAAYAETGDFNSAVKWQKEAIDLLPEEQSSWQRAKLQSLLKLYQAGKPYRQSP
jgi:tetratricopeptide (TPR) repeat protein